MLFEVSIVVKKISKNTPVFKKRKKSVLCKTFKLFESC